MIIFRSQMESLKRCSFYLPIVYTPNWLFVYLLVCLLVYLLVCLCVCLFACLFVCLLVCLFMQLGDVEPVIFGEACECDNFLCDITNGTVCSGTYTIMCIQLNPLPTITFKSQLTLYQLYPVYSSSRWHVQPFSRDAFKSQCFSGAQGVSKQSLATSLVLVHSNDHIKGPGAFQWPHQRFYAFQCPHQRSYAFQWAHQM